MLFIALDPGKATGVATWDFSTDAEAPMLETEFEWIDLCSGIETLLDVRSDIQLVCESFTPRPKVKFVPDSLRIINVCEWLLERSGCPHDLVLQPPRDGKSARSDKQLREMGWLDGRTTDHARDAARHLWVYLCKQHLIEPRTGNRVPS